MRLNKIGKNFLLSIDGFAFLADAESLVKELSSKDSELVALSQNPVDAIWEDRPARPASSVFHLDEKYTGNNLILFFCLGFVLALITKIKDDRM